MRAISFQEDSVAFGAGVNGLLDAGCIWLRLVGVRERRVVVRGGQLCPQLCAGGRKGRLRYAARILRVRAGGGNYG
jgi:hypothetical protein